MSNLLVTFLASFLIWFMFAGLLILWLVDGKVKREQVIHAFIASFIALVVSESIKIAFPTLRPFEVNGVLPLTLTIPNGSAFPSVHTSTAFALAATVQRYNKKVGIFFVVSAIMVGLGRVLGNVHYYVDIIGGAVVGIFSVFLFEKLHATGFLKTK